MPNYSTRFLLFVLFVVLTALPVRATAGELRVSSGSDYETRVLSLAPDERGEVTVFVNSGGHSPENFIVTLARSGETVEVIERRRTGVSGTVRFRDVPAGEYRITLKQELAEEDSYEVMIGDVVLSKPVRPGGGGVKPPVEEQTEGGAERQLDAGAENHSAREKLSEEKP